MSNDLALREPAPRVPSYRRHKPSGQAVVTLNGRDVYQGCLNRAVCRAIEKANATTIEEAAKAGIEPQPLPHWSPNQLRHSAATENGRQFGLEAAQVVL